MKLLTYADLQAQPTLEYLVDGLIPKGALCMLYGPSGVGKSFLALDVAHSIATGRRWLGRETQQGPGLYVIAEGFGGFGARATGWCRARGRENPGAMLYVPEMVAFHDAERVSELIVALRKADHTPAFIVVDTLAASIPGGNESSAEDMGHVIAGVKLVQAAFGSAAMIVHHTGWDTSRERGSSSIRAAMDVVLALRPFGGGIELKAEKMRDAAPPSPIPLKLVKTDGTAIPEAVIAVGGELTPAQQAILAALKDGEAHTDSEMKERAGLPNGTYYRVKADMLDKGAIEHAGRRFKLTADGRELLSNSHSQSLQNTPTGVGRQTAPTPHVLDMGVGVAAAVGDGSEEISAEEEETILRRGDLAAQAARARAKRNGTHPEAA